MREGSTGPGSSEDTLVERARGGDLRAYNELVRRCQSRAYNLAYHLLGNAEDAADVTQESFIKAYRKIGQFRGEAFEAWLLRIVVNTSYDALRVRKRHATHIVAIENPAGSDDRAVEEDRDARWRDPGETPEEKAISRELLARVYSAIEALPPDQRTVLVLSDIEGMRYEDIAAIAGAPLGTVKSRLARARARVREIVERQSRPVGIATANPVKVRHYSLL